MRLLSASRSWNSSLNLNYAAVVVYFVVAMVFYERIRPLFLPSLLACGLLCIGLLVLWINRKQRPEYLPALMPLYTTIIIVGNVLYNHQSYVHQEELLYMPYIGIKMLIVVLALAAPIKRWVGWTSIAICGLAPVIQYYLWPLETRLSLPFQEPWITSILAIAGAFLYAHRCRVYHLMQKEEQAEALRSYSQLLLSAQHLLNTPLQIIELSTTLITDSEKDRKIALENIQKSMETIRHLNKLLSFGESAIQWHHLKLPGSMAEFEKSVLEFKKIRDEN